MNAVAFQSVSKVFRQRAFFSRGAKEETHAVRDLSLDVAAGEVLGLLGPNGSGKSTTLKLVSTVLLPDDGRVTVAGIDTQSNGQAVRRQVGFALAAERSFFPRLTARENLEFFASLEDVPRRDIRLSAEAALCRVNLEECSEKQIQKFSSGMHHRLGIARALLKHPSVLLLDEPSRSLDLTAAGQLWELIQTLSADGVTILLATHNFAEAAEVCDGVAILQRGALLSTLRTRSLSERQLRDSYLQLTGGHDLVTWNEEVPA